VVPTPVAEVGFAVLEVVERLERALPNAMAPAAGEAEDAASVRGLGALDDDEYEDDE